MEIIQQLFMAAFATFVFSILVEKLTCVTINGDEWKSKRTKVYSTKSRRKNEIKSNKKVRFAAHDQVAFVVNNKLVKVDNINLPTNKQKFCPKSYDLKEVYLGANWIGEELMMCKEFGFHVELQEQEFDGTRNLRNVQSDEAQAWLEIGDDLDDQTVEA